MSSTFFYHSLKVFAPGRNGVLAEICESKGDPCKRDQKGFKAIYVRNLVYLYKATNNQALKKDIQGIIDSSLEAMLKTSCDANFNCAREWAKGARPERDVRSQHVSAALLVAAVGIRSTPAKAAGGRQ
ncbi:hypothetical protein PTTG_26717 [Puccinia triticina 1-1 BBBD Race 1]|uniref:Uncharacterized protein n=1 Tax=Puccinia triticina (isolate 1-1 / race 1 (BBBD)) TaxID=630390 RepID=A0A180GS25_PUCT1|nr:hypothetical protein PTTG_26717 [Puccinia triticina 1-1 BBBD Race 1]